jgi:hypothetical protein
MGRTLVQSNVLASGFWLLAGRGNPNSKKRNGGIHPPEPCVGGGVICVKLRSPTAVIPAKAGIQSAGNSFPGAWAVDSRFRGNDCACWPEATSNDATAPVRRGLVARATDWKWSSMHEYAGVSGEESVSPSIAGSGDRRTACVSTGCACQPMRTPASEGRTADLEKQVCATRSGRWCGATSTTTRCPGTSSA